MVAKKTAPAYPFTMPGSGCSPVAAAQHQAATGRQDRQQQSDQQDVVAGQQRALDLTNGPVSGRIGESTRGTRRKASKQRLSATYSTGSDARPKQHQLQHGQFQKVPADKNLARPKGPMPPLATRPVAFCNSKYGMPLLPPVFFSGMMAMLPGLLARQAPPGLQQVMKQPQKPQQQNQSQPQPKPSAAVLGLLSNQLKLKQQHERFTDMQAMFAASAAAAATVAAAAMPRMKAAAAAASSGKLMSPTVPAEVGMGVCKKAKSTSGEPRPVKVVTCYQDLYDLDEATESSESEDEGDYQSLPPFVMPPSATRHQALSPAAAAAAAAFSAQRAAAMTAVMTANKAVRAGTPPSVQSGADKQLPVTNNRSNRQVQREASSSSSQESTPRSKKRGNPMRRQQHMVAPHLVPSRFALEAAAMRTTSMHHGAADPGPSTPTLKLSGAAAAGYGWCPTQQYCGYHFQPPQLQPVNTASLDALAAAAAAASEELDMSADDTAGGAVSTDPGISSRDTSAVLFDAARSAAEISAELQEAVKLLLRS